MRELHFLVWSCARQLYLAIEKPMETKDRSTRVKAPTPSTSDVAAKSGGSTSRVNDDVFPNPKVRWQKQKRQETLALQKRDLYVISI